MLRLLVACGASGENGTNVLLRVEITNMKFLFLKSVYEWCFVSPFSTASFMDFLGALCVIG